MLSESKKSKDQGKVRWGGGEDKEEEEEEERGGKRREEEWLNPDCFIGESD